MEQPISNRKSTDTYLLMDYTLNTRPRVALRRLARRVHQIVFYITAPHFLNFLPATDAELTSFSRHGAEAVTSA